MGFVAKAEKRRYFGPEILTHSDITAVQDGIERKYDVYEARMLHPSRKKMICQLFHILGEAISSEVCRLTPISGLFRRPRTKTEEVN